ncbi:MAG: Peptidase Imelysin [Fluviicola sp.]|jgi:putative iron-regulated protein|uniref:imelysin family protein n=1 Tax=Fluviicola sp. TaxID=1917219 RepID=UPI002634508E|nr:imelysin family protein [Fluviicola sp.]MDF3028060.1 Peptidase Imelysin [Fluviicola sp.]
MKRTLIGIFVLASIAVTACKKNKKDDETSADQYAQHKTDIKKTYADMAFAVYKDSYTSALTLQTACHTLADNPSQATLDAAKTAWLNAREIYGLTEIFRFVDGPIDNTNDGPEGLINAWPMDENYVDYVAGEPNSGIINDLVNYPAIDASTIVQANEFGGETKISSGYHAIEFLLWGQDLSDASAGTRPYTDYVIGGTALNQARRATYLKTVADLLVSALNQVKNAWDPAITGSYYYTFQALDNQTALRKMFNSMRVLAGDELAGERIYVAYVNESQEDEHSCFSDNTHRDIYLNALAVENLYKGNYTSPFGNNVNGYALEDLVGTINADKNTTLINRFSATMGFIAVMYEPFDQAIILDAERPKVMDVVTSLQAEQEDIDAAAAVFSITF